MMQFHLYIYIYMLCACACRSKVGKSHNSSSCKSSPLWCIERVAPVQCSLCVCPLPKWSCSGSPALASGSTCFWEARKTREQSTCWLVSVGYIGFCQTSYHRIQTIGQRLCLRFGWKGQSAKSNALQLWYLTRSWTRFGSHKWSKWTIVTEERKILWTWIPSAIFDTTTSLTYPCGQRSLQIPAVPCFDSLLWKPSAQAPATLAVMGLICCWDDLRPDSCWPQSVMNPSISITQYHQHQHSPTRHYNVIITSACSWTSFNYKVHPSPTNLILAISQRGWQLMEKRMIQSR